MSQNERASLLSSSDVVSGQASPTTSATSSRRNQRIGGGTDSANTTFTSSTSRQQQRHQDQHFSSDDDETLSPSVRLTSARNAAISTAPADHDGPATEWSSGSYTSSSSSAFDSDDDDNLRGADGGEVDSDTDSYTPDWEPFVQADGSLFYIEYDDCQPIGNSAAASFVATTGTSSATNVGTVAGGSKQHTSTSTSSAGRLSSSTLNRSATRRSSSSNKKPISSKLSTLMNRNLRLGLGAVVSKSTMSSIKEQPSGFTTSAIHTHNTAVATTSVKFSEIAEGEVKLLRCIIDPTQRHKFGRRASVAEALLGISVSPFQDGQRLMVAGYMPHATLKAKVGDWLKAIDGIEVTVANLDAVLLGYGCTTEVVISLQRMSGERQPSGASDTSAAAVAALSVTRVRSWHEMAANAQQIMRVESLVGNANGSNDDDTQLSGNNAVLSVLYLTLKDLNETGSVHDAQDVLFCYPERATNPLYAVRGSFLTLNSLLMDEMYDATGGPQLSSITVHGRRYHVVYRAVDADASAVDRTAGSSDVLVVAVAAAHASAPAAKARAAELAQCMQLLQQKQTLALTNPANHRRWQAICGMVALLLRHQPHAEHVQRRFEAQLSESEWLPLPKDAQLRIDDALGEMEAMDYREWNDRPLQSHREFYVVGGAVWWAGYLLGTHLPAADLQDVEAFLRVHGVLRMLAVRGVREMLVWQEVYPASVERGLVQQNYAYGIPQGRWFLAIVARGQMLLAVLLEARHETDLLVPHITPSPFYIEEIQDTFELLKSGGLETVADAWMRANKRPQVLAMNGTGHENQVNTSAASGNQSAVGECAQSQPQPVKKAEIISILKRRNNSAENVTGADEAIVGAGGQLKMSLPGAAHQSFGGGGGSSSVNSRSFSEDSNHDDSDSDWDGFPDSQRSSSGYDLSDGTAENLLRDVSDVIPGKITAGPENILYHYVHVDCGQGVFVAAPGRTPSDPIMQAFRVACQSIHAVLQRTVRFRFMQSLVPAQSAAAQRTLVEVKEHGILMHLPPENGSTGDTGTEFWVIGRLFQSPPKELYVCHRADVPQNMVEMAFRLSMTSVG